MPQADPVAQRGLLDLAALDTELLQLQHKRQTLPENARLAELRDDHRALGEHLVAANTRVSDAEAAMQRVESDLDPAKQRLARNQQRVDAGQIADPKALRSMLEEIEHLKGRVSDLEDIELEHMQELEDATGVRDSVAQQRSVIEQQARDVIAARDTALADLDAGIAERQDRRAAAARLVPQDLLGLYDKVSARVGGAGAAELRQGRCQGCQLEINAADLRRFAAAPATEVIRCEECTRILVRTAESGL